MRDVMRLGEGGDYDEWQAEAIAVEISCWVGGWARKQVLGRNTVRARDNLGNRVAGIHAQSGGLAGRGLGHRENGLAVHPRRHMIKHASMLVKGENESGVFPAWALHERLDQRNNERRASLDIVAGSRMLIRTYLESRIDERH